MSVNILLFLSFTLFPFFLGYEQPITSQPTEMEQAIGSISEAEELVLEFKEQKGTDEWTATELNGDYVAKAEAKTDEFSQTYILLTFTDEGSALFEKITEKNIGKKLGIFINGELISAPIVNDKITGGEAMIAGNFTTKEAKDLAEALNRTVKNEK